ncbi:hypothetical protein CIB84_003004 [Bambusicola thoracicus]|uniref:C3H1-type domain-containing protein n=1 Tax=Bambusicola thoracicus TaxID=9083 RepID=A0A2P4TA86_BAMTH|nr:hypothetical protein CIB84_003004 [Bambusicola thoracicus]
MEGGTYSPRVAYGSKAAEASRSYLKEFRTEQCPLFVQHKCTQHRPYTCFHWHFVNQRRRRSIRRRDGTFNYSPDIYCTKYDETTGICPEGDECPFLHRTTGDTERRYHLRYYKTGICIHETDSKGNCTKNGVHCAFAHGPHDLRSPVYDIRSSPCPSVKHGDEWGDPSKCENGDSCQYCHTRTEQQFHPEIYKSTKCNDMQQSGSCPRGPFCAFAHVEQPPLNEDLQQSSAVSSPTQAGPVMYMPSAAGDSVPVSPSSPHAPDLSNILCRNSSLGSPSNICGSPPGAIGKPHSLESIGFPPDSVTAAGSYKKAPGFEREDQVGAEYLKSFKCQDILGILPVGSPLTSSISSSITSSLAATPPSPAGTSSIPGMNANALPFYPTSDTVESVIESALDDLDLNEFGVAALEKTFDSSTVPHTSGIMIGPGAAELARLRQELDEANGTIKQWEESWKQAKQACDAWKKEAEEANDRANTANMECELAREQREALELQVKKLQEELERIHTGQDPQFLRSFSDLETLSLSSLYTLQKQLRANLEKVDKKGLEWAKRGFHVLSRGRVEITGEDRGNTIALFYN